MAGWVLFFAGTTYAMINVRVVDGWMRISAKRLAKEIAEVQRGKFDFANLEDLLRRTEEGAETVRRRNSRGVRSVLVLVALARCFCGVSVQPPREKYAGAAPVSKFEPATRWGYLSSCDRPDTPLRLALPQRSPFRTAR